VKPVSHNITDVRHFLGVLQQAQAQGQHVRLGPGGRTLIVSNALGQATPGSAAQSHLDQQAVATRLNELVREQVWSLFYGTSSGEGRSLLRREVKPGAEVSPGASLGLSTGASSGASPTDMAQLQGLAVPTSAANAAGALADLKATLGELLAYAQEAGLDGLAQFARRSTQALGDARGTTQARLSQIVDEALPLINEFGYLGSVAGGGQDVRFRQMMEKLAQSMLLAAGPLELQRQADDVAHDAFAHHLQDQTSEKVRFDRAHALNRSEAVRMMATQEGRHLLEQRLDQAVMAAKAALRENAPAADEKSRQLHSQLGQAQDRLTSRRTGEGDAARWQQAMEIAEAHRKDLEARAQAHEEQRGGEASPMRTLFDRFGAVRQALENWIRPSVSDPRQPLSDGQGGATGHPDAADPTDRSHGRTGTAGQADRVLRQTGSDQEGGWQSPQWSEAAAGVNHEKTGQNVRQQLDQLAEQMSRTMDSALPALVSQINRSFSPGASPLSHRRAEGGGDGDRIRALMAAFASAMAELDYAYRDRSRERLRAACQHIIPHLGAIDSLLARAAAMDDRETVERLFNLRKCLMAAHGQVQPPYLAFQAVPVPPEVFREIGRCLAGAANAAVSNGTVSTDLPTHSSVLDLMKNAGEIILKTVRSLLALLQQADAGPLACRGIGPVLNVIRNRLGAGAGETTGPNLEAMPLVYALLKALEPELQFALQHSGLSQEQALIRALLTQLTELDASLNRA
jgi:hypothetical protein